MRAGICLLALLAGCGESAGGPAPLSLGEDACDVCRMIISELPFAAQIRSDGGRVERFDDLGCLAERIHKGPPPLEGWVVDHPTRQWIAAETAVFVQKAGLRTPMSSALAAFSSHEKAVAFGGSRLDYAGLRAQGRPAP